MAIIGISEVEGFARAARELHAAPNEAELLQLAVDLAGKIINGSDYVGISVVQGREISTPVASDDVARRGDALQYQLDEGPFHWHLIDVGVDHVKIKPRTPGWRRRS